MRIYEGMFVLDDARSGSNWDGVVTEVRGILERRGAEIFTCERWDERRLAYRIQGRTRAVYLLIRFTVPTEAISPIKRDCELNETILRALILRDHGSEKLHKEGLFPPQEIMLSHPPAPFPDARRSADEWRLTGLPIRESYLAQFRPRLEQSVTIDSQQIAGNVGRRVTLAGLRETHRITKTHRGESMAFVTFGDEFGLFEAVLLPDAYQHNPPDLTRYGPHIITGTIQSHHDSIAIHADRIRLL